MESVQKPEEQEASEQSAQTLAAAADLIIKDKEDGKGEKTVDQKEKEAAALKAALAAKGGKAKLYEVIKALSAMRLCKEDSAPSSILVRKKKDDGTLDSEILPAPHPPKTEPVEQTEQTEVNETKIALEGGATLENSEPCVY